MLGIVYRVIRGFLISQAGMKRTTADAGVVTLIQRFGSAANLNIHQHLGGGRRHRWISGDILWHVFIAQNDATPLGELLALQLPQPRDRERHGTFQRLGTGLGSGGHTELVETYGLLPTPPKAPRTRRALSDSPDPMCRRKALRNPRLRAARHGTSGASTVFSSFSIRGLP